MNGGLRAARAGALSRAVLLSVVLPCVVLVGARPAHASDLSIQLESGCRQWGLAQAALQNSLRAEWSDAERSALDVTLSCSRSGTLSILVESASGFQSAHLELAHLEPSLRHRAAALSVAEAASLLLDRSRRSSASEQVEAERTDGDDSPSASEPAKTAAPASASQVSDDPAASHPASEELSVEESRRVWTFRASERGRLEEQNPRTKLSEAYLHMGALMRGFARGGLLFGGRLEVEAGRFQVGVDLLSGSASGGRTLMSFGGYAAFDLYQARRGWARPDVGLRGELGYTGLDSRGTVCLGASSYTGLSFGLGASYRARLGAELGLRGWSRDQLLKDVMGVYGGLALSVAVAPQ